MKRVNKCTSFCNSHTIPQFCLKNIAKNGMVYYSNTILELPILKEDKGINESGTFHLICRDCDSKVFSDYENISAMLNKVLDEENQTPQGKNYPLHYLRDGQFKN